MADQPLKTLGPTKEQLADADDMDFVETKNEWQIFKLADGSVLQLKIQLIGVKRLKIPNPIDGSPIYIPLFPMVGPIIQRTTNVNPKLKKLVMFQENK